MSKSENWNQSSSKGEKSQANIYSAPALEKGIDILELLSEMDRALSQREISSQLGRSISEIYRMLNVLVRRGYVVSENDCYSLSTKLFQLSHIYPPTARLVAEAIPLMEKLSREIEFSCHLTVYSLAKQTVIASAEVPNGMGFHFRIGTEIGNPMSSSAQVLIAFQDEVNREIRIKECFEGSENDEISFRKSLEEVLRKGFASTKSKQFAGIHAVSFPVFDINRKAIAALSVPMLKRLDIEQTSLHEVEIRLERYADMLSRKIS